MRRHLQSNSSPFEGQNAMRLGQYAKALLALRIHASILSTGLCEAFCVGHPARNTSLQYRAHTSANVLVVYPLRLSGR